MKNNVLCKVLGHNWIYSFLDTDKGKVDVRVCSRCQTIQYWKYVIPPYNKYVWMNAVGYTKKGAERYVKGYGRE